MHYKIKEVADMVGISVRMLHHYDKIGLLKSESVSPAGYRLYTDKDLERLQQVLFFKELEFSLQEIKDIMDSPNFDRRHALETQESLLIRKKERLEEIIKIVRKTIQSMDGGKAMDKKEMFKAFDMSAIEKEQEKYAEEIKQKYGNSDAYRESQIKTSRYTKEDWDAIMEEQDRFFSKLVSLMDKGPTDPEVQKAMGELRQQVTNRFYTCTPEIFRGIGDMYVNDKRIVENVEGLAKFLRDAIHAYCDNQEE